MGELAARTIFSNDTGPFAGTGLDTLAKNQAAILELEGAQAPQSKTITDGSISPTSAYTIVDTEGSAAADDLDIISPVLSASENLHDGMVVYLKAADSERVVTVKNSGSANGINTYDGNDYVLSITHWLKLQLRSGKWYEIEGRAMETALAAAAASTPATTTARGIGRVATLAEALPGSTITNGPAFLDAGTFKVATTPTPNAVPQANDAGTLDDWVKNLTGLTQEGAKVIAHYASPSGTRYINVSVPANNGTIIAPSDGYYRFTATATAVNANIALLGYIMSSMWAPFAGFSLVTFVPVEKGAGVVVQLSNVIKMDIKFFYANGAH